MTKERVWLKDHQQNGIGKSVHIVGWGDGPFFTVREIKDNQVHLSRRDSKKVVRIVELNRCYFTKRHAAFIIAEQQFQQKSRKSK
jgi:hypothetical protein